MNRDDIIRIAWKAGFERLGHTGNDWVCYPEDIERFAALVASAEREACAKIGDYFHDSEANCGDLIRARGQA